MEQPKNDVLKVKRLHVEFQTSHGMVHAVKDVSLEVRRGRIDALVGESGSGKSVTSLTIMNLLAGNGKVISGDVTLNEKSLLKLSGKEKRQLYGDRIGMIFQDPTAALDPLFTVEQLLLEGLRKHRRMSKKQAREVAPYVIIDCGSTIASDVLSAVALMEADTVLRLVNCDLKSISYLSSQLPLLRDNKWDADKQLKVASNVKQQEASSHMEQVLGSVSFQIPHSREVETQYLEGDMLAELGLKESRAFRKEIEKISKEVFGV